MPEWVNALILPSAITIASVLLLKFVPFRRWGQAFALMLIARLGAKTAEKVEETIDKALDEFQAGMDADEKGKK